MSSINVYYRATVEIASRNPNRSKRVYGVSDYAISELDKKVFSSLQNFVPLADSSKITLSHRASSFILRIGTEDDGSNYFIWVSNKDMYCKNDI